MLDLLDEVGFGQFNTFVGGVMAPAIDRLASQGLRHNRFRTARLCSPIAHSRPAECLPLLRCTRRVCQVPQLRWGAVQRVRAL